MPGVSIGPAGTLQGDPLNAPLCVCLLELLDLNKLIRKRRF